MAGSAPSLPKNNNESGGLSPLSLLQDKLGDGILVTFDSGEGSSPSITIGSLMVNARMSDLGLMWSVAARKSLQKPARTWKKQK